LSDTNQRCFVNDRLKKKEMDFDEEPPEDFTNRKVNEGFRMEKPDILGKLLGLHEASKLQVLSKPREEDTMYMCTKFLLNMIQRSVSWLYPHTRRTSARYAPGGHRSQTDREFPTQPGPKMYSRRENHKTASVLRWMNDQATLHVVLPNQEGTVLPYSTIFSAHAAYVLEEEFAERFEHRERAAHMYAERQMAADEALENDDGEHVLSAEAREDIGLAAGRHMNAALEGMVRNRDEEKEQDDAPRRTRTLYRYGNPLLGPADAIVEMDGPAGYILFRKLWRYTRNQKNAHSEAPILRLRKWMPFAKCDECVERRKKMETEKDVDVLQALREAARAHIRFIKMQRLSYKLRCLDAIRCPSMYVSLIVDGADQSDHCLPHTCMRSHKSDQAWKLKLHLMGVIAHGHGAYVYTCPHNFAQGHNVTIQAVLDTLIQLMKDNGWAKLPEVLYLQLDNTTKQNKGRFLLAFLALLVEAGSFRKIIVSFLPVGHTHEDIDQFFSRIAVALRRHDAHSRLMLADLLKRVNVSSGGWGKVRSVVHWENVANISGWLEDKTHKLDSVTMWHQFKIVKCNDTKKVLLLAREWPATADRADYWGGMNKNHTHQPIWIPEEVPNLLADYDNVPRAMLPTSQDVGAVSSAHLQHMTKIQRDVELLLGFLGASEACKADTLRLLEVSKTAATAFEFAWDKRHIRMLLGDENRGLADSLDDVAVGDGDDDSHWKATDRCVILENIFYLMEPPRGSEEPFWIAKVKKRISEHGNRKAYLQYWEPVSEGKKKRSQRDYYRCKYGCSGSNPERTPWRQLPSLDLDEGFTIPLSMAVGKDGTGIIVAGNREENIAEIKWYVESWKPDSHMVLEDDERMPQSLIPEGRIDKPQEKVRQKRKKAPPQADKQSKKRGK
jgi:hypothetical protein